MNKQEQEQYIKEWIESIVQCAIDNKLPVKHLLSSYLIRAKDRALSAWWAYSHTNWKSEACRSQWAWCEMQVKSLESAIEAIEVGQTGKTNELS